MHLPLTIIFKYCVFTSLSRLQDYSIKFVTQDFNYLLLFLKSFFQLLQREPEHRLGCMEEREPIRSHPFFRTLDWYKLERREVPPPFKPHVVRSAWQWIIYELNFGTKYYVQSLPNHIFYIVWPTHDVVHWWHIEAWLEICYNYHPMIRLIVHWLRYTMTP